MFPSQPGECLTWLVSANHCDLSQLNTTHLVDTSQETQHLYNHPKAPIQHKPSKTLTQKERKRRKLITCSTLKNTSGESHIFDLVDTSVWCFMYYNTHHERDKQLHHGYGYLQSFCNPPMTVSKKLTLTGQLDDL